MMEIEKEVARVVEKAMGEAKRQKFEYVTPELFLYQIAEEPLFCQAFEECGGDCEKLKTDLREYMKDSLSLCRDGETPEPSADLSDLLFCAELSAQSSGRTSMDLEHLVAAYFSLDHSFALYYLQSQGVRKAELLLGLIEAKEESLGGRRVLGTEPEREAFLIPDEEEDGREKWRRYVTCLNDELEGRNPLISREEELERTMEILCRREKNNPLHIGEPGVGKTAVTYGLARLIEEGKAPEILRGAKIYALDLGAMLAGTQYRGEFEKRLKSVLEGIEKEEKPIIYMDEIHNIVGAGATGEGSFDASNLLKPYLASGRIRFIGATTHEEYKKQFEKSRGLVRRFQNVEIREPGEEAAIQILNGLKKHYETFHGVTYLKGVTEYAVHMSARYISERFLPDKAIDLMDEAGAYRRLHPQDKKRQTVGKDVIDIILSKTCRIPKKTVEKGEAKSLLNLEKRLKSQVFGQEEAVNQVANAIKFSRAGLLEPGKPLASFLFVGPTGVGKTEIAKCLAKEMGVKLIRFDMSEYGEKHGVAKLIGAPAGYVGYEEGGLLTEAVRKTPHAVLLLDEIEKAHSDIYSVLLQVMDYATLTDNQGRKADFRNMILIMTSNAGAGQLSKSKLGFSDQGQREEDAVAIMDEVKRVFQPEFRNRLNRIVIFRSIDEKTARAIGGKKLKELGLLLAERKVDFSFSEKALKLLCRKGASREYGAREMGRVIDSEIKPLLVDLLLFGSLKKGGSCCLEEREGRFAVTVGERDQKEAGRIGVRQAE